MLKQVGETALSGFLMFSALLCSEPGTAGYRVHTLRIVQVYKNGKKGGGQISPLAKVPLQTYVILGET